MSTTSTISDRTEDGGTISVEGHAILADMTAQMRKLHAVLGTVVESEIDSTALYFAIERNVKRLAAELAKAGTRINQLTDDLFQTDVKLMRADVVCKDLSNDLSNVKRQLSVLTAAKLAQQAELKTEINHWKSNHNNRVKAARMLVERIDIPIERIDAYRHYLAALQSSSNPKLAKMGAKLASTFVPNPNNEEYIPDFTAEVHSGVINPVEKP